MDYDTGAGSGLEGVGKTTLSNGCECVPGIAPHFNYHTPIDVEASQVSSFEDTVIPTNGMSCEPYDFVFEPMADYFLDMGSLKMYCRLKVTALDGTALALDQADVWPANNLLNTLWSNVTTRVNNVLLHPSGAPHHPYKSIVENLLSVEDSKSSYLSSSLYTDGEASMKTAFGKLCVGSFDLCGPISVDILRANNHLAPNNKLVLTFTRSKDAFSLIRGTGNQTDYKITIEHLSLHANRIRLHPKIYQQVLGKPGPQIYLTSHTETKLYPLAANINSWNIRAYSGNTLPHMLVVGLVDTASLEGSMDTNPFKFEHKTLNHICLKINGVRTPQDALKPDFVNNNYYQSLVHLFQNTGKYRVDSGNAITPQRFRDDCMLIPFDLSPDRCNNFHRHVAKQGAIELELGWATALAAPLTVVVVSVFNQVLQLDGESVPPVSTLY